MPIGARPVDGARRQRRGVQSWLRAAPHHHGEHDALVDAREFAVTDDAGSIREKQLEQYRIRGSPEAARGGEAQKDAQNESRDHSHSCAVPHCTLAFGSEQARNTQVVEKLLMTRAKAVEKLIPHIFF